LDTPVAAIEPDVVPSGISQMMLELKAL